MNTSDESSQEEAEQQPNPTPARVRLVIAQCAHCRCVAYQDRNGKWRDYFHGDELTDVQETIPFEQ